jgi:hypothetical protein
MAGARLAEENAAEVMSVIVPSEDPHAALFAAWISAVQARQREVVRHEPMPRVPAAETIQPATEASISDPEASD